jgi:ribonucleoside-diphosphate reductase beta chain
MMLTLAVVSIVLIIISLIVLMIKRSMIKNFFTHGSLYPEVKLTVARTNFKPFEYPQCYENWDRHEHAHWSFKELQILRYFTQGDVDVAAGYVDYLQILKQPEVRMMLFGFGAREAMHIASYSHLITTLNLPDVTYQEFMKFKAMKDKHEFVFNKKFSSNPITRFFKFLFYGYDEKVEEVATKIALFSAFIEGVQLFSSFIMLLNFTRHGLMKKMGQIIQWSITDETCHTNSMMELYRTLVDENKNFIRLDELRNRVYETARRIVELEDNFIDLAFEMGDMRDLTKDEVKAYIRYITDRRLTTMGYKGIYGTNENPLDWVADILNAPTHTNFFENKPTEYAKASLTGEWPW